MGNEFNELIVCSLELYLDTLGMSHTCLSCPCWFLANPSYFKLCPMFFPLLKWCAISKISVLQGFGTIITSGLFNCYDFLTNSPLFQLKKLFFSPAFLLIDSIVSSSFCNIRSCSWVILLKGGNLFAFPSIVANHLFCCWRKFHPLGNIVFSCCSSNFSSRSFPIQH